MKSIFRRILVITLCLFAFFESIYAQTETTVTETSTSSIERSMMIPSSGTDSSDDISNDSATESTAWILIRMVLVLALICLLIWFVGKLVKKRMDPGAEPDLYLKKTSQLTLAPGRTLQIVTFRDRAYVLGVSESGITVIDKIDGKGDVSENQVKVTDKELIDDMNLNADMNLKAKPMDFAAMISSMTNSSKRPENFLKNKRLNLKNNEERK